MILTGAEILIRCLLEQEVDTIFGYPGGKVLDIYNMLYKYSEQINHILTAHEQGACHAADGYARATGKVGVVLATSGPGATNLITGIANAQMDSIPLVAITGNVPAMLLGKDSFQEVDIAGITMPITKHSFIVKSTDQLADTIRRAFYIAKEGRPGAVLVDITQNTSSGTCDYVPQAPKTVVSVTKTIKEEHIDYALKLIAEAERPFILAGGGVAISGAGKEVCSLAEKIDAPVADTLMGKGSVPGTHRLYTGMAGMHGSESANMGIMNSDLLIVIGSRFNDRIVGNAESFAKDSKILQFDIDPAEFNKNINSHHQVIGDIKQILTRILPHVKKCNHPEWINEIEKIKNEKPLKYQKNKLTAQYFIEQLYNKTEGNAVITTEVGQHQMWAAQFYKYSYPRQLITSGGLGAMGYGLGASIGASIGLGRKKVYNIAGDGSFRMNLNELATVARNRLPIVEVVVNNSVLGMVRQWQTLFYDKNYSQTTLDDKFDYTKIAQAFGIRAFTVSDCSEVDDVLNEAIAADYPVFIDLRVPKDEMVIPMIPPNGSIAQPLQLDDF